MNLGILLQHYFPYGGLQRDAVRFAHHANEATLVVSPSNSQPDGVKLLSLKSGGKTNHSKLARFSRDCQNLDQFTTTIAFSRVSGSDFHFCGDPCYREHFLKKKPAIAGLLPRYHFYLENERRIFGKESPTHIFFLSESAVPSFQEYYDLPSSRYTVLPPWLERPTLSAPETSPIHAELKLAPETPLLLFVASNYQLKGLDLVLQSLPRLSGEAEECHLVVCGQDDPKPSQKLADSLQVASKVHFMGSRDDIPAIMMQSRLLVHPARMEAAGMVLTEALTHQLPTLCTDLCGYASHTIAAGCLNLSSDPDTHEIASKIEESLTKRETIIPQIQAWCSQPGRYETADLMLAKISRDH